MHAEGWRRLWELMKWVAAIGAGFYVMLKLIQTTPKDSLSQGQLGIGIMCGTIITSLAVYGSLHALEWVYRGFRPLPIAPTVEGQSPPAEPSEPIPAQEQLPALPNPDSQRKT